jgi:hypothetical protein
MQNIIIKTYGDKRTLWVSEYYIVQRTGVSDVVLRNNRAMYKAGKRKCWRWDRINGGFYYAWETIPNKAPVCYQQTVGTYEELLMQGMGVKMSRADVLANGKQKLLHAYHEYEETTRAAITFYNKHEYEYAHKNSTELAEAYTWCKVVLNYTYKEGKRWILLGCDKIADVYEIMVELLAERGLKALRASSITSLYNKIAGFSKLETTDDQYNYFVHSGVGNKNSVILCEEVKLAIQYLRGLGSNWSDNMIARKVIQMAINMGFPVPTERTIEEYMNTKAVQTIAEQGRHGVNGKFRRITNGSMPIALPLFAGDCWQMDGTRINMVSHVAEDGKECFLYIVAVRDVYSGEYLGWSYGYNEDHTMYINALQMACEATLHLPYELVRDKFPGHNTQAWKQIEESLIKYGVKITETHLAQGKAQMERAFGTLQSVFMANTPYYYGEGIRSTRRYAHRSAEYLQQLKKVRKQIGWDFDTACNVQDGVMERYNTTVISTYSKRQIHYSPKELYAQSEQQNVIAIANWQVARLFYLRKTIQIGAGGMITKNILPNRGRQPLRYSKY